MLGAPGLALEMIRELLQDEGVLLVGSDEATAGQATVAVLVEPDAALWAAARASGLPVVVVVSERIDERGVVSAVLAGADAVLHGDTPRARVVAVLEEVARGGAVLDSTQVRALADVARAASRPEISLSKREGEILASILRGEAVKQTARGLGISPKTVENLQSRLFRKLDVQNRVQAVLRARELGLF